MRGVIEILAYTLIELPWTASTQILQKPVEAEKLKESFVKDQVSITEIIFLNHFSFSNTRVKFSSFVIFVKYHEM